MGRRTLTVRQLLGSVPTSSNMIEYPRQSVRTNAAAVVTEGSEKPESAIEFTLQTAPVRTVALTGSRPADRSSTTLRNSVTSSTPNCGTASPSKSKTSY